MELYDYKYLEVRNGKRLFDAHVPPLFDYRHDTAMSGALLIDEVPPPVQAAVSQQATPRPILLIEDDSARSTRRPVPGLTEKDNILPVTVRAHRIIGKSSLPIAERSYTAGETEGNTSRTAIALEIIDDLEAALSENLVIAGTHYGATGSFIQGLNQRRLDFAVEIPPSAMVQLPIESDSETFGDSKKVVDLFWNAEWHTTQVVHPTTERAIDYLWADMGMVSRQGIVARLFIVQTGTVKRLQPGTIFVLTNCFGSNQPAIVATITWTRWIRPLVRKSERTARPKREANKALLAEGDAAGGTTETGRIAALPVELDSRDGETTLIPTPVGEVPLGAQRELPIPLRVNITLSRQRDEAANGTLPFVPAATCLRGVLTAENEVLRIAELFAGAGGMGLGFLTAGVGTRRYRLVCSGEVHPIYVRTLHRNHQYFLQQFQPDCCDVVPHDIEPLNLRQTEASEAIQAACQGAGGIDVLIGGPPCQGLSSANRNSGAPNNPHNELIDVFLDYVELLHPRVFLMENVQGIVWTPKDGNPEQLSVAEDFKRRARDAGYLVFPKLLDAAWFGVPQHRNRFFVIGISIDLGYEADDFGEWGPFPLPTHWPGTDRPYVTVHEAIGDLPRIHNGESSPVMQYQPAPETLAANDYLRQMRTGAPEGIIWDHIASRHSSYVLERYDLIPEGGNWQDIEHLLSNYADIRRTHSNIYRRLHREDPSITIGHYRKSMIVHPTQLRGLSLREACRLMSFPDWFRFIGTLDGSPGGLTHQQQQVANAVCPLVTRAIAEFILRL